MYLYRIGNVIHRMKVPFVHHIFNLLIRLVHNCAVYSQTDIGKGTVFGYGGIGVVVHKRAQIGKKCVIGSNVTIGGRSKSKGVPVIGDEVFIGTGAKLLGEITVGDNCVIGANAVVISDVPANSMVAGIPAKIIRTGIQAKDYY